MNISVIGTGYVGLVQGTILSEFGHSVTCLDVDKEKIESLKRCVSPIYEPGLEKIIERNYQKGNLIFSTDVEREIERAEIIFIAVGTPPMEDGSADLQYVLEVAKKIGETMNSYKMIINKSTVPVGTGDLVEKTIREELKRRGLELDFDVVSNPEFLREGKAVEDCLYPDRVVIGSENERGSEIVKNIYKKLSERDTPFVITNRKTAEMIKYASNSFLAVKISFINELSALAEKVGANTEEIANAMGMDKRISPAFFRCGAGYGGSCFPKDTKAIVNIAKQYDEELSIINSAILANEKQKNRMVQKIEKEMNGIKGKVIGVLGLSFKPETDDVRDAPSLTIIKGLIEKGAKIKVYCPKGMKEGKERLKGFENWIEYCNNQIEATSKVEAVVLMTEWKEFKDIDFNALKERMQGEFLFDLRNLYLNNSKIREIFRYIPVGQR